LGKLIFGISMLQVSSLSMEALSFGSSLTFGSFLPPSFHKLNFDGATSGIHGLVEIGDNSRDEMGQVCACFSSNIGIAINDFVEIMPCLQEL